MKDPPSDLDPSIAELWQFESRLRSLTLEPNLDALDEIVASIQDATKRATVARLRAHPMDLVQFEQNCRCHMTPEAFASWEELVLVPLREAQEAAEKDGA